MPDSNNTAFNTALPGAVVILCLLTTGCGLVFGFSSLFIKGNPDAGGLCLIAAAIASGSLARAIMS